MSGATALPGLALIAILAGAFLITMVLRLSGYPYADFWQSLIILVFGIVLGVAVRFLILVLFGPLPLPIHQGLAEFAGVALCCQYVTASGWQRAALVGGVWGAAALAAGLFGVLL